MAYENVKFNYQNFCIGSQAGTFCSIDTTNANAVMQVKNSSGDLLTSYTLSPTIAQYTQVGSLEYTGPRNLNNFYDGLPFWTLIRDSSVQCTVTLWKLSVSGNTLDKDYSLVLTTSGNNYFDSNTMAVEYYHTEFNGSTVTGTGQITIDTYNNIEVGDVLMLGPSTDVDNLNALEYVTVTSGLGGGTFSITNDSGPKPTLYEYVDTDPITYWKSLMVFSDVGQNNDLTKGSLHKVDYSDGSILDTHNSAIYNGVVASAWSLDYQSSGFVKGNNILYADHNVNYQITKSQTITNINSNEYDVFDVYDLIFDNNSIYRLQRYITLRGSDGTKYTYDWITGGFGYNYHQDTIAPYTLTIDANAIPDGILMNQESMYFKAVVRDQFGVGLNNKLLYFTKTGDAGGNFDPLNGQVYTNPSGIAYINYDAGYYDPDAGGGDVETISISAKTDGGSTYLGVTGYDGSIWENTEIFLRKKYNTNLQNFTQKPTLSGTWPTVGSDLYTQAYMQQLEDKDIDIYLPSLSNFQFPGGHWSAGNPPVDTTAVIKQIYQRSDDVYLNQLDNEFSTDVYMDQELEQSNELQISQLYISRHKTAGHTDDVNVDQFRFIEDAIPAFWSEKNPVNTDIWIRVRPFAFSLNQSTLVFKVREISYAGDTGFVDVTSSCSVSTFDAGGGLLGLDITYNPPQDFHHNAVVYIELEVYDIAATPNRVWVDYWFKIIPDFKAPYLTNLSPGREETNVGIHPVIEFNVMDAGVGVDINTLEFYVNNRYKLTTSSGISGGYHISYTPTNDFYYGETVEIAVVVKDSASNENTLYDTWRFYIVESTGPWFDEDSFYPKNCSEGVYRKIKDIQFNVFAIDDTGLDRNSIKATIDEKERNMVITPIVYRIS